MSNFLSASGPRRVFTHKVTTTESQELFADYARSGSDAAFGELVSRYLDLCLLNGLAVALRWTSQKHPATKSATSKSQAIGWSAL